jgi:Peptidase A4 family
LSRHPSANPQGIPIDYSGNWSGYLALPERGSGKATSFKYVSASCSVPSVNPGGAITSSVIYDGGGNHTLALTGQTSGQAFDEEESCASTCGNSSAEVITEGYTSAPYDGTADFGEEHYDTAQVQSAGGTLGGLTSTHWSTIESIALGGTTGDIDTEPGPLFKATKESAFPITWYQED